MPKSLNAMPRIQIAAAALLALFATTVHAAGDAEAGKTKAYTCTGCHGIPGYKNTYPNYDVPKVGAQSATYLAAALQAYQSGARKHPTMNGHAQSLSAQDIDDVSAWFASLPAAALGHEVTGKAAAGEDKSVPCQACHGANGIAVDAMYPNLAGQHASYIRKSLQDYRDGQRVNPLMSGFATNLSDQDIEDLAAWFASQPGLRDLSSD
jgi:cytochrome c553